MNNIEELIAELCPEGVEIKELGELCERIVSGKNSQRVEDGKFPVYGSTGIIGHTNAYIFDKECLLIARVGANAGFVHRGKGKFDVSDNTLIVKPKEVYNLSFAYYQLTFLGLNKLAKGGGQPLITAGNIKKILIPIPPLPIQQEIVNILDKFTALQTELQAELQARRAQYEYYRNELLNFEGKEVEWAEIEKVFHIRNGYTPSKAKVEFWTNGTIPWFRMDDIRTNGHILSDSIQHITPEAVKGNKLFPSNSIIVSTSATIGEHALLTVDSLANQRFTYLTRKENYVHKLDIKFFFYYMFILDEWCKININISGFAGVDMPKFRKYKIPIPPLAEQERIAAILDKFDKLVNDKSVGLPVEIQARRKQYEYYRGKLLDFKSISNG